MTKTNQSEANRSLKERLVSLFRPEDEELQDVHYHGKPLRRLLTYLKPHRKVFVLCLCLVLALTALDLIEDPVLLAGIKADHAEALARQ